MTLSSSRIRRVGENPLLLAFLLVLGWLGYGAVGDHQLLRWDDVSYVSANPHVQSLSTANLVHILTGFTLENWHPLTWASYLLNYLTGTADVTGLKYTNLALHVLASFFAGLVAERIVTCRMGARSDTLPVARMTALVTAILFCVHPQHVESVTWVAERKDVLCGLFFLACLAVYLGDGAGGGDGEGGPRNRVSPLVAMLALLAMLSKPMAVSLPVVLIAADLFPLGRIRAARVRVIMELVAEKWLVILCSAVVAVITLLGQSPQGLDGFGWADRLAVSLQALGFYVRQFFYPVEFVPFHPVSAFLSPSLPLVWIGFAVLLVPVIACLPSLPATVRGASLAGFLYFVTTLLPVLGIVKVGEQAFADRYAYIPVLPLHVLAGWMLARLLLGGSGMRRLVVAVLATVIAVGLIHKTRVEVSTWASDETLWTRVVAIYPARSALAHMNLGNVFYSQQRFEQALEQYDIALSLNPADLRALYNRALVLEKLNRAGELGEAYSRMVRRNPDNPLAWAWFGEFALRNGRIDEARDLFMIALNLDARTDVALFGMARIRISSGDRATGEQMLRRIDPHSAYYSAARKILRKQ